MLARIGILFLIYLAFITQSTAAHWLPTSIGTPQLLLILLVWIVGKIPPGREILLGAALGLLADVLEPEGLGRNYLLFAAAAWWSVRFLHARNQEPTWSRSLLALTLCSLTIPALSSIARAFLQQLPLDFPRLLQNTFTSALTTLALGTLWFTAIALIHRETRSWIRSSSDPLMKNRWTMLTD